MEWISPSETWIYFHGHVDLFPWTGGSFLPEYTFYAFIPRIGSGVRPQSMITIEKNRREERRTA
jgi:hypothetical protein